MPQHSSILPAAGDDDLGLVAGLAGGAEGHDVTCWVSYSVSKIPLRFSDILFQNDSGFLLRILHAY